MMQKIKSLMGKPPTASHFYCIYISQVAYKWNQFGLKCISHTILKWKGEEGKRPKA